MTQVSDNLSEIRGRIAAAAARSGCPPERVKLVAVTKYVGVSVIRDLVAAGCHDLGESRPQELWTKSAELTDPSIHWHLIGHLQRNKIDRTLPLVSLIHSADSLRLIKSLSENRLGRGGQSPFAPRAPKKGTVPDSSRIGSKSVDQAAAVLDRVIPVLLEVNISGDRTKHGFTPEEMKSRLVDIVEFDRVQVRGLMAMAGREGDVDSARRDFARMRELRDRLRRDLPDGMSLDELSMGMSGDFEVAIEEGATIVRIGSALFEGVGE